MRECQVLKDLFWHFLKTSTKITMLNYSKGMLPLDWMQKN